MKKRQSLDELRLFKKVKCEICGKKFSKDEEHMNHMQIIHGNEHSYDCRTCGKNFSNMESMRTHLQREHSYRKDGQQSI